MKMILPACVAAIAISTGCVSTQTPASPAPQAKTVSQQGATLK